jgi:hypothetical protein
MIRILEWIKKRDYWVKSLITEIENNHNLAYEKNISIDKHKVKIEILKRVYLQNKKLL